VDIDALWIDMNEAANFCDWPCSDPVAWAQEHNFPPEPPAARPNPSSLPGFPEVFQPGHGNAKKAGRRDQEPGKKLGLQGRDLINPPYQIANAAGSISNHTINTDLIHSNGLAEYDTHNLYGTRKLATLRSIGC
jgi:alpha-glucosidase